jgi:UDP-N-acetylglucosamine 2-epimerase (non-hydrolysing)
MKIINVVGARPNFMKIAPVIEELHRYPHVEQLLVHTEQHYDEKMSALFFGDLGMPRPDLCLGAGSGSHAEQTSRIMLAFEKVLLEHKPSLVIVVGDVNSTIACALTAVKLCIPVAHIEAGLRSFDRSMPEEINRILTDAISDYLFVTEESGKENLLREGVPEKKIHFVGNCMIDTLLKNRKKAAASHILDDTGLAQKEFALLTLHRPSNVDNRQTFEGILTALDHIQKRLPILYPVHPRTRKQIEGYGLAERFEFLKGKPGSSCIMTEPLGYLDFLRAMSEAKVVLTDSGGIQEETTVLGVPCVTLRENTERPVTVEQGTNVLAGTSPEKIIAAVEAIVQGEQRPSRIPEKWDGQAAQRIAEILVESLNRHCEPRHPAGR